MEIESVKPLLYPDLRNSENDSKVQGGRELAGLAFDESVVGGVVPTAGDALDPIVILGQNSR